MAEVSGFAIDASKMAAALRRVILDDTKWNGLNSAYLRGFIEIEGMSVEDANEVRESVTFRFCKNGTRRSIRIIGTGGESLLSWNIESGDV